MNGKKSAASKKSLGQNVSCRAWIIILFVILVYPISSANAATNVLIKAELTQFLGGEFRLDIMVDSVENLYGIAFDLHYDADTLELMDADPAKDGIQIKYLEGSLLNNDGTDPTHVKMALEDNTPGKLVIGLSRSGDVEGVSSSSETVSVSIFFRSKDTGDAEFIVSRQGLRDSENQVIGDSKWDELLVNVEDYEWEGDVDHSKSIDLEDMVLVLKILSGQSTESIYADADINEDGKLGMEEAINPLQK